MNQNRGATSKITSFWSLLLGTLMVPCAHFYTISEPCNVQQTITNIVHLLLPSFAHVLCTSLNINIYGTKYRLSGDRYLHCIISWYYFRDLWRSLIWRVYWPILFTLRNLHKIYIRKWKYIFAANLPEWRHVSILLKEGAKM